MRGIPGVNEKDWKLFRSRIPDWQEAYMDRLNHEWRNGSARIRKTVVFRLK